VLCAQVGNKLFVSVCGCCTSFLLLLGVLPAILFCHKRAGLSHVITSACPPQLFVLGWHIKRRCADYIFERRCRNARSTAIVRPVLINCHLSPLKQRYPIISLTRLRERVEAMWSTWQSPKNPASSPAVCPLVLHDGKGLKAGIVAHFNGTQLHEVTQSLQHVFVDAAGF
jgi:hypothetical protein